MLVCEIDKLLVHFTIYDRLLWYDLLNYRLKWVGRKTKINGYNKSVHKETPRYLKAAFASFERKIKGKPFFINDNVKNEYLSGIHRIYENYYNDKSTVQKLSKKDKYIMYLAENYILYGSGYKSISFDEFVKRGLSKNYR